MLTTTATTPEVINDLTSGVYPAFAMLAGMQLDLFTPLGDGPMSAQELADALGVGPAKLKPLLYSLVTANLLRVNGEVFSNTSEANHFLVQGRPSYSAIGTRPWLSVGRQYSKLGSLSAPEQLRAKSIFPPYLETLWSLHPASITRQRSRPGMI